MSGNAGAKRLAIAIFLALGRFDLLIEGIKIGKKIR
jgi:hypothetical protein